MIKSEYTLDCILRSLQAMDAPKTNILESVTESAIAIDAAGEYTPAEDIDVSMANAVTIMIENKGASTNLEVAAYCSLGTFSYTSNPIEIVELNATTNKVEIMFIPTLFDKLHLVFTNKDNANATTIDYVYHIYGKN